MVWEGKPWQTAPLPDYQPVPYDITRGSKDLGIHMGGKAHRLYTLGHDPILGWLFGTANILTDCMTFHTLQTHRIRRKGGMVITPEVVPLPQMFAEAYEMARSDRLNLPAAIFSQAMHFQSDAYTKMGLPVPILSTLNTDFASKLYLEHYDSLCLDRDMKIAGGAWFVSKLVDTVIGLVHGLFRPEQVPQELYEVRTKKILLVSNSIASSSSILATAITKNPRQLDLGGLLHTISHLFTDIRFLSNLREEYIQRAISERERCTMDEVDDLYCHLRRCMCCSASDLYSLYRLQEKGGTTCRKYY